MISYLAISLILSSTLELLLYTRTKKNETWQHSYSLVPTNSAYSNYYGNIIYSHLSPLYELQVSLSSRAVFCFWAETVGAAVDRFKDLIGLFTPSSTLECHNLLSSSYNDLRIDPGNSIPIEERVISEQDIPTVLPIPAISLIF